MGTLTTELMEARKEVEENATFLQEVKEKMQKSTIIEYEKP